MPELDVLKLSKSFSDTVVLDDVAFSVPDGEFCVLLGPSGCGKTTLLRIIAGLEPQTSGRILFGGEDLTDLSPRERDVAMVFQSYALYPHMTVFENMAFPLKARKTPKGEIRTKVQRAAELLGLDGFLDRKPKELSGGQRQRVAIGRAIVRNPRLFLFDEPLSNLDASLRSEMRLELANLHRTLAATVIYVTHDQIEAMTLADKIVLLHEGRVQQIGPPTELYARPANLFVAGFIGSPRMNLLRGHLESDGASLVFKNDNLRVDLADLGLARDEAGHEVVLGIRPEALSPAQTNGETLRPWPTLATLTAEVEMVEQLGAEVIVHARCGECQLTVKSDPTWRAERGSEIRLQWDPNRSHFFRLDSGMAIRPRDERDQDD
jgi:ABC-type sugar transport system ATPase subunit